MGTRKQEQAGHSGCLAHCPPLCTIPGAPREQRRMTPWNQAACGPGEGPPSSHSTECPQPALQPGPWHPKAQLGWRDGWPVPSDSEPPLSFAQEAPPTCNIFSFQGSPAKAWPWPWPPGKGPPYYFSWVENREGGIHFAMESTNKLI